MGDIRPLTLDDGARLAEIHLSVFGHYGNTEDEVRRAYTAPSISMILDHRYRDHVAPSLVFELDGKVVGFVLTMCRPAIYNDDRVWLATTSHLAVEEESRPSLAAIHLLRAVAAGPQDATYIDRSNSAGRKAEQAAGFVPLPSHSLRWTRLMRPGDAASARLAQASRSPLLLRAGPLLDRTMPNKVRNRLSAELPPRPTAIATGELTIDHVTQTGASLLDSPALHPVLDDAEHVRHEWDLLARAQRNAQLVRRVLLSKRGDVVGWYLFFVDPHKRAEVVQFVAKRPAQRMAFLHLLHDLSETDAMDASGRLPLSLLYDIEDLGCKITTHEASTAIHTESSEIRSAFTQNKVWLSGLEGEVLISPLTTVPR